MKKEEILEKSRKENKGKLDELGMKHIADAGKIGMVVGASLCVLFVVLAEIFNTPIIGLSAWSIYFAMMGSNRLYLYIKERNSLNLVQTILWLSFAVAFLVGTIVLCVRNYGR